MNLRVARHTNNLETIKLFYIEILGFTELGHFEGHDGYDGIFIGNPGSDWHLEFTQSSEKALHQSDEDDIIVLYPATKNEYELLLNNLSESNIPFIEPKNPYWKENGSMFMDPDGFRIVISPLKINL
ncbi:MAG: prolyl endopeptidase [Flavobacterium sp. BFFFF1]|uniref:VOC family protein n=1 Tax=unclassified Flavobacterium TaxID=196869 RepID=UPI000BC73630|nr:MULTISPECIES: VOC family protein [unclassified Flavobacterium]OYU79567.1 MAG: prolyl endopeptidase [Flavobacterium sp. BFFFF1]